MSAVSTASGFLSMIEFCKYINRTVRIDPHVYCHMRVEHEMEFIATDENDWFGTLIVQWPMIPPQELAMKVDLLLIKIGSGTMPKFFHYEVHEMWGIIRAECRLPIHNFYDQEDLEDAVKMFYLEWTTVRPFIQRVLDGEDVDVVAADAIPAMETMRREFKD